MYCIGESSNRLIISFGTIHIFPSLSKYVLACNVVILFHFMRIVRYDILLAAKHFNSIYDVAVTHAQAILEN